ncbi:twin-arginine translocase TatA/TatE family subunit [Propionibacteriaceae bacterium G1746]|uniref:twin-arginine translocase TatA/TatE family subunit n=1 Tax=Aestuariimicrobium sp. G57 TaxID=3418485 RepID=UPI003C274F31
MAGFGWQELLIILAVALLLFGGSRLAGIGKASGRAIREFKEETRDLKSTPADSAEVETKQAAEDKVIDATVVDDTVAHVDDAHVENKQQQA